jgi:hypothetical protein
MQKEDYMFMITLYLFRSWERTTFIILPLVSGLPG